MGILSEQSDIECICWCVWKWVFRTPSCLEFSLFMSNYEHTFCMRTCSHAKNVPDLGGLSFVFLGIHTFLNPSKENLKVPARVYTPIFVLL